ncbi:unnamed protein product [Nesidiocoris tenuis]|uniref:Uncharacterized protein n=1 Tax=Nesidiocoris tenuis TaxID=355587 RepID=A0A6H5HIL6_9HEMI|nr:unnamed protein product [Nesidiocoris tenuis]
MAWEIGEKYPFLGESNPGDAERPQYYGIVLILWKNCEWNMRQFIENSATFSAKHQFQLEKKLLLLIKQMPRRVFSTARVLPTDLCIGIRDI